MQLQDVGWIPPSLSLEALPAAPNEQQMRDACPIHGNPEVGTTVRCLMSHSISVDFMYLKPRAWYMFRVVETVVLENGRFVPCRKQPVLTKTGETSDIAFHPPKTRDFAPQTPEIDENDEHGGCHPDKMTVCQKHRFDNLDMSHIRS